MFLPTWSSFVSILLVITTDLGIKVVRVRNDLPGIVIFVTQHRNFDCVSVNLQAKFPRFSPRERDRMSYGVSQTHFSSAKEGMMIRALAMLI